MRRKSSDVWQHFTPVREQDEHGKVVKKAKCNHCPPDSKVLQTKDGTANLWKHLKRRHPHEVAADKAQQQQPPVVADADDNGEGPGASAAAAPCRAGGKRSAPEGSEVQPSPVAPSGSDDSLRLVVVDEDGRGGKRACPEVMSRAEGAAWQDRGQDAVAAAAVNPQGSLSADPALSFVGVDAEDFCRLPPHATGAFDRATSALHCSELVSRLSQEPMETLSARASALSWQQLIMSRALEASHSRALAKQARKVEELARGKEDAEVATQDALENLAAVKDQLVQTKQALASRASMYPRDKEEARLHLAWMIVDGGYDPAIVEDACFQDFARCLNREFEVPSRIDIEEICDDLFNREEKRKACDVRKYMDTRNFSLSVGKVKTMEQEVLYIVCHFVDTGTGLLHRMVMDAYVVAPQGEYCHGPLLGVREAPLELLPNRILSDIASRGKLFMMACADDPSVHELKHRIEQVVLRSPTNRELFCAKYILMDNVIHSIAGCLLPDLDFTKRIFSVLNDLKLTRQDREILLWEHSLDDPREYNEPWYSCYSSLEVIRKERSSTISREDLEVIEILCNVWEKLLSCHSNNFSLQDKTHFTPLPQGVV